MIQARKKSRCVALLFLALVGFTASPSRALSPTVQKVVGYAKTGTGYLCLFGAGNFALNTFGTFSKNDVSRAYNRKASDAIGVLAGYGYEMLPSVACASCGIYLINSGQQDVQEAQERERRAAVQAALQARFARVHAKISNTFSDIWNGR